MTEISIELVPRSAEGVEAEVAAVCEHFPEVRTVNIPDLMRFELRSWQACALARARLPRAIPHLRAMDFDGDRPFPLADVFREHGLGDVLIVSGDPPQDMSRRVYPTGVLDLIPLVKQALPEVRVYAAFDPYRSGVREELDYVEAKLEAGADGLFSQPFFDLRLMDVWSELLSGTELWWGISPVTRPRQRRWWEAKNRAVFPAGFEPTLKWNRRFAREALEWARGRDTNLYYMPIRTDLVEYLDGILDAPA
jgi:methylenetetrahydrofolate reductase (NADPH)